jgi:hypothetical protein
MTTKTAPARNTHKLQDLARRFERIEKLTREQGEAFPSKAVIAPSGGRIRLASSSTQVRRIQLLAVRSKQKRPHPFRHHR